MSETPEQPIPNAHKAGFVSIVGKPNVGKSTLMNQLVGEKLSIITPKAQTTRHRIMGIINDENYQVVYSDTPGVMKPNYELHAAMMGFVRGSLEDADVILYVVDATDPSDDLEMLELLAPVTTPILVLVNKVDVLNHGQADALVASWATKLPKAARILPISALKNQNINIVFGEIVRLLPIHPPYFDKDELTDKSERFFASEILREKIFLNYQKEIPYSSEVIVVSFKEEADIIRIHADIIVERKSQKGIIIGKGGEMLKKIGMEARKDMETFFGKKIYLEQYVKVEPDWRKKENQLRRFGYKLD